LQSAASAQSSLGGLGDLAVVWRSVAREDQFRIECAEKIEACSGLSRVGVEHARHELWSAVAVVEYIAGHKGISGEQGLALRQVERRVADCVAGGIHDLWTTGQVEDVAVSERDDRLDARCLHNADREEPREEPPRAELPEGQLSDLHLVAYLVANNNRALDLAGPDFGTGAIDLSGKAHVVGVGVGQDDRLDIVTFHPDRGKTLFELGELLGTSRIDDRRFATFCDQIEVVNGCAQPINAIADLMHTSTLGRHRRSVNYGRRLGYDVHVAEERNAKERLLGAASTLMYTRGYNSVGVAEICRTADVNKGSFYYFFDSKEALALEALDRSWAWTRSTINASSLGDPTQGGLEAIDKYGNCLADGLEQRKTDGDAVPGCMLGNFAVELSTQNEHIRARVSAHLDDLVDSASLAIIRSIELGGISPTTNVELTARDVVAQMEGLMVLAKARRDPDLLRELGPTIRRLLT